jgi:hypothetical protein
MLEGLTPPAQTTGGCKVSTVVDTLTESDAKILLEAIANPAWPVKALERALRERGLFISNTPLGNHRKQSCACFR